jgi:pyruvate carboxylase
MKIQEETLIELEPGKVIIVKLLSVSDPNEDGIRTVFFKINGENKMIEVLDKKLNISKVENIKADENNIDEIGSPLQGLLYKVLVKKGQEIKENDPLFIIEAMKKETTVTAIRDCKVKSIMLKEGEMIMQDDLILNVE